MDEAKNWAIDIAGWVEMAKGRVDLVVEKVCMDVSASVIEKSPVGNPDLWEYHDYADLGEGKKQKIDGSGHKRKPPAGYVGGRFRNSWQAALGSIPTGDGRSPDASGSASYASATGAATGASGKVFYLSNNLPYARRLEYGWSKQSPNGMVATTVDEFAQTVAAAVAAAKNKGNA